MAGAVVSMEQAIQQATRRELERRAVWIEYQVTRALPGPVVWALRATGWLWLARLTGVALRYRQHPDMSTTIEVVRRGRVVAQRRFAVPAL